MASSYNNSDIEACCLQPSCEKSAQAEDAASETRSNQRTILTDLLQIVPHVVSFTVTIWLVVQVLHLQHEVIQLNSENTRLLGRYPGGTDPHTEQPADQPADPNNHTTSGVDGGKYRSRRQANPQSSPGIGSSYYDYDYGSDHGHPSFHVTGNEQPVLGYGNWFTFHTSLDPGYSRYSHESLKFVHSKFFEVTLPGYYFVYSQMCYAGQGDDVIGHEVVVLTDCGDGSQFTILRATASQLESSSGDTGYIGGVFYLAANDRLGVRALQSSSVTSRYHDDTAQTSYFGGFLMTEDRPVEVDPDLRRCP